MKLIYGFKCVLTLSTDFNCQARADPDAISKGFDTFREPTI